jgi:hypothetical protein
MGRAVVVPPHTRDDPEARLQHHVTKEPGGSWEQEEILRSAEELRRPIELADARLEDYDGVPSDVCPSTSPVIAIAECPSRSAMALMFAPDSSHDTAAE